MEQPASKELRGFLAQLESVGQTESEGTFTLSPQTAARTMRRFQLPDPYMYILQMVAAATVGRSEHLAVETAINFDFNKYERPSKKLVIYLVLGIKSLGPLVLT